MTWTSTLGWNASHGSTPKPGPGIVTAAEVMGDITIAITVPLSVSVPMQTNGTTLRIATSGTALASALDITKITLSVSDRGHDTGGNQVFRNRTINVRAILVGPYNQMTSYQPVLGEFYLKLDDFLFNQDATWKTTITSINLGAGWLTGQSAATVTTVTRSDSLAYFNFPIKSPTAPWQRVASGGTLPFELAVAHSYPSALVGAGGSPSMVACIEAWAVDSAVTAGTVVRGSTFTRSLLTPNNATTKGLPVPTYQVNVDPAGLLAGRCEVRWTVKPWIGPPVNSATIGDAYPTINAAVGVPFGYDTDGSHAPLYALLNYDPVAVNSPAWTRSIATNQTVTTVDVSGLCTTLAGALAGGVYYADLATLATAVRRVNKGPGTFTILSANGLSTQTYGRTTFHDDLSGGVAVCPSVPSSVVGANLGCYSNRFTTSSQVNFPPGITMFEIRSDTGLPKTDARWRGVNSDGTATSSKNHMSRMRMRGLYLDGVGLATAADNTVFDGGAGNGAPTVTVTETAAVYVHRVDCEVHATISVAAGASVCQRQSGWLLDERVADYNPSSTMEISQGPASMAGPIALIGSLYQIDNNRTTLGVGDPGTVLGCKLYGIMIGSPGTSTTSTGVKPLLKGRIAFNVDAWINNTSDVSSVAWDDGGGNYPMTGGTARVNLLGRLDTTTGTQSGFRAMGDNSRVDYDNYILWHVTIAAKAGGGAGTGRFNVGYGEQGWTRVPNRRVTGGYTASQGYNCKGDAMNAPETPVSAGDGAWVSTTAYHVGNILTDGTNGYEVIQTVPASSGILLSNTAYYYNGGPQGTAYGSQPLRQGNSDFRYHVGFRGVVASNTSNGDTGTGVNSWYGNAWGPGEKLQQTYANYFTNIAADNYTPNVAGPLKNMVPSGGAVVPFDLVGTALLNDGTDSSGAMQ